MNPLEAQPCCALHSALKQSYFSPTSGYEPPLDMDAWNKIKELRESHNCFMYAYNAIDPKLVKTCRDDPDCDQGFPQPGYASGFKQFSDQKEKGCGDMVSRLWGDNPKVKATTFEEKCPAGTSKIALIVDPKRDYHFLRENPPKKKNGVLYSDWSHKPGAMEVTLKDASGRPIIRPDRALFLYKKSKDPLMYTDFCGYFCVPRDRPIHAMAQVREDDPAVMNGGKKNVVSASLRPKRHRRTRRARKRATRRLKR
jgi:hypothetical protein